MLYKEMDDLAAPVLAPAMTADADDDASELTARLADSGRLAFKVAYGVLRNRQDAEDVAQEAFARAHLRRETLRDRERFRGWLVRITWRLAIDRQRADRRRVRREQSAVPQALLDGEEQAARREREERLWTAVDALPEAFRSVVILAAIEGYDVREVARLLDVPEGTVKSRLHTARKRLAESLRCLVHVTKTT